MAKTQKPFVKGSRQIAGWNDGVAYVSCLHQIDMFRNTLDFYVNGFVFQHPMSDEQIATFKECAERFRQEVDELYLRAEELEQRYQNSGQTLRARGGYLELFNGSHKRILGALARVERR